MKAVVAEENEGLKVTDGFHLNFLKGCNMLFLPL
jgi:hypothetical protein